MLHRSFWSVVTTLVIAACLASCSRNSSNYSPNTPPDDEAKRNGLTADRYRYEAAKGKNNFFAGMDVIAVPAAGTTAALPVYQLLDKNGAKPSPGVVNFTDPVSTPNEVLGRNTWMAWCGGNEGFWDWLAKNSYGFLDFLKVIDSRKRPTRFATGGLINEPGMRQASQPDENGLWIDVPAGGKQPIELAEIYGKSTGVIGLRLFPNPDFDAAAKARWDANKYYNDPDYYNDPRLIRPYRVGMSCAFCHASFHPLNPPANVAEPQWDNISGSIGAQYLRIRAVVGNLLKPDNVVYHILDSQLPGTVDTSLVASDNINNANAMNGIFCLKERVIRSFINSQEEQGSHSLGQPAIWGKPDEQLPQGDDGFVWGAAPGGKKGLVYRSREVDRIPPPYWGAFQNFPPPTRLSDTLDGKPRNPDTLSPAVRDLLGSGAGYGWKDGKAETGWLLDRLKNSNSTDRTSERYVPRILFDGADSIGGWGALARVYLNIGTYWEQWIRLHNSLVGFTKQQPFLISDCEQHSVYWQATQERVAPLRDYFLKITPPMPLLAARDTEGMARLLKAEPAATGAGTVTANPAPARKPSPQEMALHVDVAKLQHGRKVFARNCIICHSSIQPLERQVEYDQWAAKNEPWDHDPGHWLELKEYRQWAEKAVEDPSFWQNNFLSTDYRVPISLIGSNPGRALGTNGLGGNMWNDFTSDTYKKMPSVGTLTFFNPFTHKSDSFQPRHQVPEGSPAGGGGVGFYRVPSLVSIWATAPFLHNNSVGNFTNDPSVKGRLEAFDDAIRKLLNPPLRLAGSIDETLTGAEKIYNGATPERLARDKGLIWRTTQTTYLTLPGKYVPSILNQRLHFIGLAQDWYEKNTMHHPLFRAVFEHPVRIFVVLLIVAYLFFIYFGHTSDPDPVVVARWRWWARWLGYLFVALAVLISSSIYLLTGRIGTLRIGPIPAGTPVNLISNLNPDAGASNLTKATSKTIESMARIDSQHFQGKALQDEIDQNLGPALLEVSKCPDFVMDKGHYYPWFEKMSAEDKDALIELLKTF